MSQLRARLFDAKTGDPVAEEVMVLLAAVPPREARLVHKGVHYRVLGVEYALDGALVVFVTASSPPVYASESRPSEKDVDEHEDLQSMPALVGCSRCGGAFADSVRAREMHAAHCLGREGSAQRQLEALRQLGLRNLGAVITGEALIAAARVGESEGVERTKPSCTGLAASWCSIHGDCSCERQDTGERVEESEHCPLHGSSSEHGDAT